MISSAIHIGGACLNQTPIDWDNNIENIKYAIKTAKSQHIDLLCLPELCITGYGCEDMFSNQWLTQKAIDYLLEIKIYTSQIAVCVGLPVHFLGHVYNTVCILHNQQLLGFYAKQNLANDGVHYENRWFKAWKADQLATIDIKGKKYPFGKSIYSIKGFKVGLEICEDAWSIHRTAHTFSQKVDIILNPSASHFAFGKSKLRESMAIKSSTEFNCVYLYVNLLGNEAGRLIYDGDVIMANKGKLIAVNQRFSFKNVSLSSVPIDKNLKNLNPVKLIQTNRYEEFANAASLGLFDYLRKSKSKGFTLSISGGADSSCIAVLVHLTFKKALEELGTNTFEEKLGIKLYDTTLEKITSQLFTTAYQRTHYSSLQTFNSAQALAKSIGARFYHWNINKNISNVTKEMEKTMGKKMDLEKDDLALQNIQARSRAPYIWMLANLENALLLTTSNRSEASTGYATMDGDTCGSIAPIAGVSKKFILQWIQYAEDKLGYSGLKKVNRLIPSAELRPQAFDQTDEVDLMPYDVLESIERNAILNGYSPKQTFHSLKDRYEHETLKRWIKKFYTLWCKNQWKRDRYPPSFHFDDFNIDPRSWCRFPILNSGFKDEIEQL